ncbi:MAG: Ig-like domain-containing protein, partial [Thaumarchaeota archaeon]|nr:Ig-like domain-containing protein [Nitrososphaerota archaeon]
MTTLKGRLAALSLFFILIMGSTITFASPFEAAYADDNDFDEQSLLELKQSLLDTLSDLKTGEPSTDKKIDRAIKHLDKSTDLKFWDELGDSLTNEKKSKEVFHQERRAVHSLYKLLNYGDSRHDLDLVKSDFVGLRFNNIDVPQGATITNAFVQFTAEDKDSGDSTITIYGHDIGNAPTFTTNERDISSRTTTDAEVIWNIPSWKDKASGEAQQTSDISPIVQEIVDRSDWSSDNSLAIIFGPEKSGRDKDAHSYDSDPASAPVLHITYKSSGPESETINITSKISIFSDDAEEGDKYKNRIVLGVPTPEIQAVIDILVGIDRQLAEDAIAKAQVHAGEKDVDRELEKANRELDKAQEELDKGKPHNAIDHYRHAWEHALHAIKLHPVVVDDSVTTEEDTAVVVDVLANDGVEDKLLAIKTITQGINGQVVSFNENTVTYVPNLNFNGDDTFTYTASNGKAQSTATVFVTVTPVNDVPIAVVGEDQTVDELTDVTLDGINSFDIDENILSYSWLQISGADASLNDANTSTPSFSAPDV